jgi:GrpB-like predicted nucleotidyltransferase (UPF0157 family)
MPQLPIGKYLTLPATVADWDPRFTIVARQLSELISGACAELIVEHVGSTSVPGCAGKGVIDLLVLYSLHLQPESGLDQAKATLARLGFQHQSSATPFPEERPMRVGSWEYDGSLFRIHAHVLAADAMECREFIAFRDALRSDPDLVGSYLREKRAVIASGITDSAAYYHDDRAPSSAVG